MVDGYTGYTRYIAIGDSQTEGLWDGDDVVGLRGFADRLAVLLDSHYPGLHYANLAIRGTLVTDVLREQVPPALAMQPDLITVCVGMNDVIQPGRSFGRALADLETLYAALAGSGATVVTTTFPNVAQFLPLGWLVSGRLARINDAIRESAARYDHVHVGMMGQRRTPGMEDGEDADAGAEMFGIGRDRQHRLRRGFEQQIVDHRLVLIGDVGDLPRQAEHHVEVRHRQQFRLALGQPFLGRRPLALGAMPVATGIVGNSGV